MKRNLGENYSPFFFLAALGNGGMSVAFYIFFMFMTPHEETPIATFDTIWAYLNTRPFYATLLSIIVYVMLLYFAFNHIRLLVWNIREYRLYKQSEAYKRRINSNNGIVLMAIPLTLTMTINVIFVLGAILVPGLWNIVEYLLPVAFAAFFAAGIYSLSIFYRYYSNLLLNGHFEHTLNNSLSQMLSSFTFAMNAVGFAAPVAMSQNKLLIPYAAFCSIFFLVIALLLAFKNLILGFHAMLEQGLSRESSGSIWILIPILTLIGITVYRLNHGFHYIFNCHGSPAFNFIFGSCIVSLQIFIGILGYILLRNNNYFNEFIHGRNFDKEEAAATPASYSLICPGVAFWVFGMFFITLALVRTELLSMFSANYFIMVLPFFLILIQTIRVNWKLNRRLLDETKK